MIQNKKRGLFRSTSRLFLRPNNEKAADQALINAAFIRAKAAVQYDAEGQVQLALEAYAETIGLLCQVKHETTTTPLQHIHDAYADRIVALSTAHTIEEEGRTPSLCSNSQDSITPPSSPLASCCPSDITTPPPQQPQTQAEESHVMPSRSLPPHPPPSLTEHLYHWTLMKKLRQSMIDGGYITGRLYAPKELWHQPEVEMLPDLDKKLALAEYLLSVLKSTRHDPLDPALTMQELHRLETALYVNPSDIGNTNTTTSTGSTSNNVSSTMASAASSIKSTMGSMQHWRASWKWSKRPVEIIRNERSIDDRYPMYIRTLIKLFSTAQFLDGWYSEYSDLVAVSPASTVDIYQRILCKISMCAEALGRIVCTTVLGDFQVIWDAYMAKNHRWIDDDL